MTESNSIAGLFGLHRLGEASGLFAALLALPSAWGLHFLGGFPLLALAAIGFAILTIWAAPRASVPVIIDRVAGQWLALWPLSGGLWAMGLPSHVFPWPGWVGGFLICQVLLNFVPPIRRLAKYGPLWDDLAAGAAAAAITLFSAAIAHGWL